MANAQTQNDWAQYSELQQERARIQGTGDWDATAANAIRIRDFVLQRYPKRMHFLAYEPLAEARLLQGRYDEALQLYMQINESLQAFRPRSDVERQFLFNVGFAYRGAALSLENLGRHAEAVPYFKRAIDWWERSNFPLAAMAASARASLAACYDNMGKYDEAAEQYPLAVAALERLAHNEQPPGLSTGNLAYALKSWSHFDKRQGRLDRAEPKIRRAVALILSAFPISHPQSADILSEMGDTLELQGRWDEAEVYYRTALDSYEDSNGRDHPRALEPRANVARVLRKKERYGEAEAEFRQLLALTETHFGQEHQRTATALVNLSATLYLQGKHDEAERLMRRAIEINESADTLHLLASNLNALGRRDEALKLLDRALEVHERWPASPAQLSGIYFTRASALWATGQRDDAFQAVESALQQTEIQRGFSAGTERERATLFEQSAFQFDLLIQWQAELGNVQEMFAAIERKKARSFLDELLLKNVDILEGLSEEARQRLNNRTEELRRRLSLAQAQLDKMPEPGDDRTAEVQEEIRRAALEVRAARDALYEHLNDMRASSPVYQKLITRASETASLAELQQQLAEGDVVLTYHVGDTSAGDGTCYVVIVRHDAAEFQPLEVNADAAATLGIEAGPLTGNGLSTVLMDKKQGVLPALSDADSDEDELKKKLAALWTILIPEKLQAELTGDDVGLLTVLPAGSLALLPFEALVVSNDPDTTYFLDTGPRIAYAPSAAVLLNLAGRGGSEAFQRERVLTLGDPAYSQQTEGQDSLDRHLSVSRPDDRFRAGLSRLPYSGLEAEWVKQLFDKAGMTAVKLIERQASESQLRRLISGREIVHLACHGMASQSYGNFFGSLAIAPGRVEDPNDDGFLSMGEIYELDLSGCELAILSACETNYGPQQKGEGVWALSRGFIVAGCRRVVASNWVVDDQAGATLVSYFASLLARAGTDASARDYASALHKAKQLVRKDQDAHGWDHPFYWSSLVLVGPN